MILPDEDKELKFYISKAPEWAGGTMLTKLQVPDLVASLLTPDLDRLEINIKRLKSGDYFASWIAHDTNI